MSSSVRPYLHLDFHQAVDAERRYQDAKWGAGRVHNWPEWFAILGQEVGEVAEAVKQIYWVSGHDQEQVDELRSELIQVAAVCKAMVEQLDAEAAR